MSGRVTIRQYVPGQDDEAWVGIYNRARSAAPEFVPATVEELRRNNARPSFTPDGMFVAESGGAAVGRIDAWYRPERATKVAYIDGPEVLPEVRRCGIGTVLMERALESLRARGAERAESGAGDWNIAGQAFLRKHGFEPSHTYSRMERSLAPVTGIGENGDVELRSFGDSDEDVATYYELYKSTFSEYHNFSIGTLEDFTHFIRHQQDGGDTVEHYFALARGRPVGYVVLAVGRAENAQLGTKRGWVNNIGVLKEHRHQGIATRLLIQAIERLRVLGMDSVVLSVDDQNVTCARRVYERVGFEVVRSYLSFERRLDPAR